MQARAIWMVGSASMATTAGEDIAGVGLDVVLVRWCATWLLLGT